MLEKQDSENRQYPNQPPMPIGQDASDFELMVNSVRDYAIILLDPTGHVASWNPGAERCKGYEAEEIIGQHFSRFYPVEAVERGFPDQELQRAAMEGRFEDEGWRVRKDGSRFWANVLITALRDENGQLRGFAKITRDLTERRQAEEELRDALTHARCILWRGQVTAREGWEQDPENRHATLFWERSVQDEHAAQQVLPLHQATGQSYKDAWKDSLHDEDRWRMNQTAHRALREGAPGYAQDFCCTNKFGERCWLHEDVVIQPSGPNHWELFAVVTDITERKQVEEQLKKSEAQLAEAQRLAHIGSWEWDFTGKGSWWSDEMYRIYGVSPQEFQPNGSRTANFVHPDDQEYVAAALKKATHEHLPLELEFRIVHPDGVVRHLFAKSVIVMDDTGRTRKMFGTTQDITERKLAEEKLRRAHDELEDRVQSRTAELTKVNVELQSAKEAADKANMAKSEFLSRMSHELRTPLNAILGFGQILTMENLDPLAKDSTEHILKAGYHLLKLVNEVLDITSVETGRMDLSLEPVAVSGVVREAVALVRSLAAQSNITMDESEIISSQIHVMADQQRLKQVFINLLSNALKYNRPGGKVWVSYQVMPQGNVRIAVSDTGFGIAPENLPRLFVPFERLDADKAAIEGTGLGLALSKRMVEVMGGTMSVESVVGEGSTFYIELPAADSLRQQVEAQNDLQTEGMAPHKSFTVLLIEDNASNYRLIETVLKYRPGAKLLGAMQGSIGLDLARRHTPDIILLDLHLPDMGGYEVLRHLRAYHETAGIPVIVVSADATPNQVQRLLAAGAAAYLTKPINVKEFLSVLDEMLERKTSEPS
jgi:PAS domain S-box-containing protein